MQVDSDSSDLQPAPAAFQYHGKRPSKEKTHRKVKPTPRNRDLGTVDIALSPAVAPPVPAAALLELQGMVTALLRDELDSSTLAGMSLAERKTALERLRTKARVMEEGLEMARIALAQMTLN